MPTCTNMASKYQAKKLYQNLKIFLMAFKTFIVYDTSGKNMENISNIIKLGSELSIKKNNT